MNKLMKFVYSAVITVIAGAAASYFTRFGIYNWYAALDKPFKNYSVTEALLLIVAIFAGVSLIGKLFKRRVY